MTTQVKNAFLVAGPNLMDSAFSGANSAQFEPATSSLEEGES